MKKNRIVGACVVLLVATAGSLVWAENDSAEELLALSQAKISLSQAIDAALTAVPGKALSAELDDEGDQGAYVVEVVRNNQISEIRLDSQTGKLLDKRLNAEDDDDSNDQRD